MIQIRNYIEDVVFDALDTIIKDLDVCQCESCKHDIAAITLNSLPPKYVVTRKGELYTKINTLHQQFDVDTISAITKASTIVKKYPRHE